MRQLFHDPVSQAAFEKNGYVVLDFIRPEVLAEIIQVYDNLTPDDKFNPDDSRYHCTFIDGNVEYKTKTFELLRNTCAPLINAVMIDYKILIGNFYVKPPGCGEFEVHQNWNLLDETLHTSVTIWIPLQDTTEQNGTIEVVPGSNKIVGNINTLHAPFFFLEFTNELKSNYLKPVNLKMGQAIIFDDNIIHYSKSNSSGSSRSAIQLACTPKEAEDLFYFVDPANDRTIEIYETNFRFYLDHNFTHVINRPPLKYLGKTENKNVSITESEFVTLLSQGEEIRKEFYHNTRIRRKKKAGFFSGLFSKLQGI